MNKSISMFGHLLQVIPKTEFFTAVKETGSERSAKGFSCWAQFVAMLFCQMGCNTTVETVPKSVIEKCTTQIGSYSPLGEVAQWLPGRYAWTSCC